MKKESIGIKGIVSYVLTDKDGNIKEEKTITNQVQNLGIAAIASRLYGATVDEFGAIAIGSGTGQAVGDTTLATEITTNGGERRDGTDVTITAQTDTIANDTAQFVTTYSFSGPLTITEAGIFNDGSVGTMFAYQDFSAINVANGDNLQITWKVIFS